MGKKRIITKGSSGVDQGLKSRALDKLPKKKIPYAASKVSELIAEKAKMLGIKDVGIKVRGIGAGRESAIRSFAAQGFNIGFIRDLTPIPHNGPKPPKPRRV